LDRPANARCNFVACRNIREMASNVTGRSSRLCGLLDRMRSVVGVMWLVVYVCVCDLSALPGAEAGALAGIA